jgi:hypothetical protein
MTLWKKEIPIFKMLFLILLETKESLLKQESIRLMLCLKMKTRMKMRMKIFLTTSTLE